MPNLLKSEFSTEVMAKQILIIDDEAAILEVIQACLEELGNWEVRTAKSGLEGLSLARSEVPDGILLDVSMPGMDGFEVLQELQNHPHTQDIPVILLTARVQPEDRAKFATLGIAGAILKPFDPLELVNQVANGFSWEL